MFYRVGPPARKQDLGRASLFLSSRGARGPGRTLFLSASRAADGARAADSLKISCAFGACVVSSAPSGPHARSRCAPRLSALRRHGGRGGAAASQQRTAEARAWLLRTADKAKSSADLRAARCSPTTTRFVMTPTTSSNTG